MSDKKITLKIHPDEYGFVAVDLRKHGFETNRDYEICVKPWRDNRSDRQNRYYWGIVVREVASHTGYTDEEAHEILKHLFLSRVALIGEGSVTIARSTKHLNTVEFEEYLSKVRQWASRELSVYLPLPNEVNAY